MGSGGTNRNEPSYPPRIAFSRNEFSVKISTGLPSSFASVTRMRDEIRKGSARMVFPFTSKFTRVTAVIRRFESRVASILYSVALSGGSECHPDCRTALDSNAHQVSKLGLAAEL